MDSNIASALISAVFSGYGPDLENEDFDADTASDNVIGLVEGLLAQAWDEGRTASRWPTLVQTNPYRKEKHNEMSES